MRGPINLYEPWDLVLKGLLIFPVVYVAAFSRISFGSITGMFLALIGVIIWAGSLVDIPLYHMRTRKPPFSEDAVHILEKRYKVSLKENMLSGNPRLFHSAISLNLSILVMLIVSIMLLSSKLWVEHLVIILITWVIVYLASDFEGGVGIITPSYVFLTPLIVGLVINHPYSASLIFSSGVLGFFLAHITMLGSAKDEYGSPVISIGGAGNYEVYYALFIVSAIFGWMG